MAIGDIWELTLRGSLFSQEILNVFHYEETTGLGVDVDGSDVASWFWDTCGDALKTLVSSQVTYSQVDALQVTGGVGIGSFVISSGAGGGAGDCLPSFIAYSFRYNRASQASRHGYKRFAGVLEGVGSGNSYSPDAPTLAATINALESDIFDDTTVLDGRLQPVILSRVVNGAERPVPLAFPVSSIVFTGVTTQNTRKP